MINQVAVNTVHSQKGAAHVETGTYPTWPKHMEFGK